MGSLPREMADIAIANEQLLLSIDEDAVRRAAGGVFQEAGIVGASLSLAIVVDDAIHRLNRQYLGHDYPTDVLSFLLEQTESHLEGEVIVSAETALAQASRFGWSPHDELLLYVIHGTLHLVGYDDRSPEQEAKMRRAEALHLERLGIASHAVPAEAELGGDNGAEPSAAPLEGDSIR